MSSKRKNRDLSARQRRMREKGRVPWSYIIPAIVILVIIVGLIYFNSRSNVSTTTSGNVNTSLYPFPCLSNEQLVFHIHIWLRIVIDGQNVTIPAAIGIANPVFQDYHGVQVAGGGPGSCFEPMHTHDNSGIIHIESASDINYTLNDFFSIWNVTYGSIAFNGELHPIIFNSSDILGYRADETHKILLLVDGVQNLFYDSLVLNQYDYCNSSNAQVPPCYPTAGGAPYWNGGIYPYGTGHTVVIEYVTN